MIEVNDRLTPLSDELLSSLHPEIKEQLIDAVTNIEFIKRMVAPDRPRARDLPKDLYGRVLVDLCNPHILEDMDYFRLPALYFKKHGVYTHLRPNGNPNSEYGKWIRREIKRIWYGMRRRSDGEWIPGDMYWYLNYSPIILDEIIEGTNTADRITDFPHVWDGIYLMFHYLHQAREGGLYSEGKTGQHAVEIAKRGASKSYTMASIMSKGFVTGFNKRSRKSTKSIVMAYDKEKLNKDGTLNKFELMIDFLAENTLFPHLRLLSSLDKMTWKLGYLDKYTGVKKGLLNEVYGVSSKDNVDKARGKRANRFIYEEFGAFPKFLDVWSVNRRSVLNGNISYGLAIAIGTGGSEGSNFQGALEMIYHPKGYNVYALPNVYDKNALGKQSSVFFFGAYLDRAGHYDKDGNSDVVGALIEIFLDRFTTKYNSSDPMLLTRVIAEDPITILEAIMRREATIYPINDLTELLNNLDLNPSSYDDIWVGKLVINGKEVEYRTDSELRSIRHFPHKDNKVEGAVEIFSMPEKNSEGKVYDGRYIAGIDTYDDDVSETLSLGSIYILDLWTDKIVFEYTGRPMFASDFYENCRRALLMYNAIANYENNKKGLFAYFDKMNSTYLLSEVLDFLKDREKVGRETYGNKLYGTNATAFVKSYGRRALKEWLLKPVPSIEIIDGEETEVTVRNLTFIRSRALIQELLLWNPDNNFDRHDAMVMLMLLREDRLRFLGEDPKGESEREDSEYLGNDEFFTNNYDARKNLYHDDRLEKWYARLSE